MSNHVIGVYTPPQLRTEMNKLSELGICAKELFTAVIEKHLTGHGDWIYGCLESVVADAVLFRNCEATEFEYADMYNKLYPVLNYALCQLEHAIEPFIADVIDYSANDVDEVLCYEQPQQYTLLVSFRAPEAGTHCDAPLPF